MNASQPLSWIEVSRPHLLHNVRSFKNLIGTERVLCPAVKGNAYGHGLVDCAPLVVEGGADFLGVNALFEALSLKKIGIQKPIYIMGYVLNGELEAVVQEGFQMVVYNLETLQKLAELCEKYKKEVSTHLKVETGNYRQGILWEELETFLDFYRRNPRVKLAGVSTHFSNIEDTNDPQYARQQLEHFQKFLQRIREAGFQPAYIHCANTAATLLFPETHFTMVRAGIGTYGLWPSEEVRRLFKKNVPDFELYPVLSWKTRIAQIKKVPKGALIGYGCTYQAPQDMKLAILPVGYYDGYFRSLSNRAYVVIRGKKAPLRGRVCMNILMVEVTNIPEAHVEDEAILIGEQNGVGITADQLAEWTGTIHWEITTRLNEKVLRKVVG